MMVVTLITSLFNKIRKFN